MLTQEDLETYEAAQAYLVNFMERYRKYQVREKAYYQALEKKFKQTRLLKILAVLDNHLSDFVEQDPEIKEIVFPALTGNAG